MLRLASLAAAAVVLLGAVLAPPEGGAKKKRAKEEGPGRPVGTWTRTQGDAKIVFEIRKRSLRCTLTEGDKRLTADADYAVTKDGVLFGRISKVENKDFGGAPDEGSLFSFRFAHKGGTLTISDLQSHGGAEARQMIEGEYKGSPGKKKKEE